MKRKEMEMTDDDVASHSNSDDRVSAVATQQLQQQQQPEDEQVLLSPSPLPPPTLLTSFAMPIDGAAGTCGSVIASAPASLLAVKKRRTKNFKLREDMARARGSIDVRIPALDPPTFATWDDFIRAWGEYMSATKTLYRRRSSCTTAAWNSRYKVKKFAVPDSFQYATMAYWCTHGCIQPSRSTGVRAHLHNRFTGCMARITADVVYETRGGGNDVQWFIRVRNQVVHHNHKISDEIFQCYTNNSSVPDELLLGPSATELDAHASPRRSLDASDTGDDETEFETSSRMLAELNDDDDGSEVYKLTQRVHSHGSATGPEAATNTVEERRVQMARAELQPLLHELKRTSPRVIHKRLQDVSEMVAHLVKKWHGDRIAEEQMQATGRAPLGFVSSTASSTGEPQQHHHVTSSSNTPSVYGDGPGALVPHRIETFPSTAATSAVPASDALNSRHLSVSTSGVSSTASAADAATSRHRNPYDLVG